MVFLEEAEIQRLTDYYSWGYMVICDTRFLLSSGQESASSTVPREYASLSLDASEQHEHVVSQTGSEQQAQFIQVKVGTESREWPRLLV